MTSKFQPGAAGTQRQAAQPEFHFCAPVVTPCGDGSFNVRPGKVSVGVEEIETEAAMDILGLKGRSSMYAARDSALGAKHLRWRFTSESQRRILWEKPSVLAYKEALKTLGK